MVNFQLLFRVIDVRRLKIRRLKALGLIDVIAAF
jgi:hypothetical protein